MQNKKIQSAYLDEWVIITMLIISVAAIMITVFQYKNYQYCAPFDLNAKAEFYHTGEPIRFETNARNINILQWNFGDNKQEQSKINSIVHVYNQPGEYLVSTTLNDNCSEYKTIFITKAPVTTNPVLIPKMFCPQSAVIGKPVQFNDSTEGARSWEWRFGENASVDATSSSPTYIYKTSGLKTVSLVVNGDPQQLAVQKIYVNEPEDVQPKAAYRKPSSGTRQPSFVIVPAKPLTPSIDAQTDSIHEPKPKAESISRQDLELRLRKVADGLMSANDFAPYMCSNVNIPVSLDGQTMTFAQFCSKLATLKSEKKIKELNAQQIKSNETGCIVSLNIHLKTKSKFLGLF